ncbi:MAG: DUF4199 domain-containing protein, partial [Bacteroidia bacterium]|nr:DUF4199 domain-containing protein [Bacteroidia bacterium]
KVVMRYAGIASVLGVALLVGLYYMGRHPFLIPVFFDFRIILFGVFIFFALKEFRDFHQNGVLYFWQGLAGSVAFISLYGAIASALILLFELAEPEFLKSYIEKQMAQLRSLPAEVVERIGKEVVTRNLEALPATNVYALPKLYMFQGFVIGLFVSIIISVILKKQPTT